MRTFWKVLRNYKKIIALVIKIAEAARDKKLTDAEVREVMEAAVPLAINLGLVEKEAQEE